MAEFEFKIGQEFDTEKIKEQLCGNKEVNRVILAAFQTDIINVSPRQAKNWDEWREITLRYYSNKKIIQSQLADEYGVTCETIGDRIRKVIGFWAYKLGLEIDMSNIGKTNNKGFANMEDGLKREIAANGGWINHQNGTAHEFNSDEAKIAGHNGGIVSSKSKQCHQ